MTTWTDDHVETLKRMWREGCSAAQIAGEIPGVSRSAVLGKVHRLGIAGDVPSTKPLPPPRKPQPEPPADGGRTIIELRSGECRFPVGERSGTHLFCGNHVRFGSWCPGHRAMVFQPRASS